MTWWNWTATISESAQESKGLKKQMNRAVRLFLVQIEEDGRIPFAVEVLNAETRKAMEELETGGGVAHSTVDEVFKELDL